MVKEKENVRIASINMKNGHHAAGDNSGGQGGGSSDVVSLRSISSDDVSGATEGQCCSAEARNPVLKKGRRIQLLQVSEIFLYVYHKTMVFYIRYIFKTLFLFYMELFWNFNALYNI